MALAERETADSIEIDHHTQTSTEPYYPSYFESNIQGLNPYYVHKLPVVIIRGFSSEKVSRMVDDYRKNNIPDVGDLSPKEFDAFVQEAYRPFRYKLIRTIKQALSYFRKTI